MGRSQTISSQSFSNGPPGREISGTLPQVVGWLSQWLLIFPLRKARVVSTTSSHRSP